MPRFILSLTILLLFLLEGTILQVLTPNAWGLSWMAVPRFALVGTIMISLFFG